MTTSFRQTMTPVHTWSGLVVGWILFFVFLTGSAGYFDAEIDRWMQPERRLVAASVPVDSAVAAARRRLETMAPQAERWFIELPGPRAPDLRVFWRDIAIEGGVPKTRQEMLDPSTGHPIAYRETGGGQLLYMMHYRLHYLPAEASYWIVGICTMAMLVAIVTGVVIHKRIFRDFFTFRRGKGRRSWLDAHNALSVLALPFHIMITYSGLIFFADLYMAPVIAASYGLETTGQQTFYDELRSRDLLPGRRGEPAPLAPLQPMLAEASQRLGAGDVGFINVYYPGDANARVAVFGGAYNPSRQVTRLLFDGVSGQLLEASGDRSVPLTIYQSFMGVHEGLFAGAVLRWLYFFSGLVGTAMIGAGLILWTAKRRERIGETFGFRLVESLNVGAIIGLPVAIAAYFWANRLIPVELGGRAAWEAHAMFVAWAALLLHAFLRPNGRAWGEQLWLAAAAYGLLPLLNALTTDRHLGVTLPAGVWELAGVDLTMLAFGLVFTLVAWRIGRRRASGPARHPADRLAAETMRKEAVE